MSPENSTSSAERREAELVLRSKDDPLLTVSSLSEEFSRLGVKSGMTLLVHSSLSSLGWVCGGAAAVILALENVLGEEGTLVMPTHSTDLSDPTNWQHPPVPESWWQKILDETPAFMPDLTPTKQMGAIPESFRKQNSTLRSYHPQVSFAARGKNAKFVTANHGLAYSLGEGSPLARVYDLNGFVLLLGVGHSNNTSIHQAEYRVDFPAKKPVRLGAPISVNGKREWVWFDDINFDNSDFERIGADFSRETGVVVFGKVGLAKALFMSQKNLVDYSSGWIKKNRI
jgi:aminoglycoside 3-N-acetyltransferase